MATGNKSKASNGNKKRKTFLPHNKPVKKGSYPLRPGIQGFFITCDGGREFQAAQEALNVLDSFFEELVQGEKPNPQSAEPSQLPGNKKTKFVYSDSSEDEDEDGDKSNEESEDKAASSIELKDNSVSDDVGDGSVTVLTEKKLETQKEADQSHEEQRAEKTEQSHEEQKAEKTEQSHEEQKAEKTDQSHEEQKAEKNNDEKDGNIHENEVADGEPPSKKHRVETVALACPNSESRKVEEKSIDKLIEAELAELGDKSKRRFSKLDSGCNGVIFILMRKIDGDPSPKDIALHIMSSLAATRKHVSRFMLRVLPIELTCYASEEEITRAMKPLVEKHFPTETERPHKFAVLYEARANTGIDRMKIINAVAKSVPQPHSVDLSNPDKHIVVQICKTVCLIGVVEKYKELAKFNMRQLSSPKPE